MDYRWRAGLSPFNGQCLNTNDVLAIEDLRSFLSVIIAELKKDHGAQTIYVFDDWHQHDGFITKRQVTAWDSLEKLGLRTDILIKTRLGDDHVHRSFYPDDFSFLLRVNVFNDDDSGDSADFSGTFDLSANPQVIGQLLSCAPTDLRPRLRVDQTKAYFDLTYAG